MALLLKGRFINETMLKGRFGTVIRTGSGGDPYTGEYIVIPTSSEQTLETKQKLMMDDVTIRKIPYFETSNESGKTVYIGNL